MNARMLGRRVTAVMLCVSLPALAQQPLSVPPMPEPARVKSATSDAPVAEDEDIQNLNLSQLHAEYDRVDALRPSAGPTVALITLGGAGLFAAGLSFLIGLNEQSTSMAYAPYGSSSPSGAVIAGIAFGLIGVILLVTGLVSHHSNSELRRPFNDKLDALSERMEQLEAKK